VAIVDDIRRDRRTKNVLAQTNTKTVSVPQASTGLVGDQAPAEIFTVSDFDLIKNQIHLEEENFQLMEALNTMGQITNMQSQSGPIVGTGFIHVTLNPSSSAQDGFIPPAGTIWQWMGGGASLGSASGTVKSYTSMYTPASGIDHDGSAASFVIVEDSDTSDYTAISYTVPDAPIYVSSNNYLRIQVNGTYTSSESSVKMAYIRVR
jgi:hypothetical protein